MLVWNSELKPKGSSLHDDLEEDSGEAQTPRLAQAALPIFCPDDAAEAGDVERGAAAARHGAMREGVCEMCGYGTCC
jgi:hypothetical protein